MSRESLPHQSNDPPTDFMQVLPPELAMIVLVNLDIPSLCYASQACQDWNSVIQDTDYLWKLVCEHHCEDPTEVAEDRAKGYSWKETLRRNFGYHAIKRRWLRGEFSNISKCDDLPPNHMCVMDAETWGMIFEMELTRGK